MSMIDDVIKDMGVTVITEDQHDPRYGMMPGDRCVYKHENRVVICTHIWDGWFYGRKEDDGKFFMCGVKGLEKL